MKKQTKKIARWAMDRGWRYKQTKGGHIKFTHPLGGLVIASLSPKNADNAAQHLKRDIENQERQRDEY